jgi:hypothetical protein
MRRMIGTAAVLLAVTLPAAAQSGGGFDITEAVVAGAGGPSSNGEVGVDATAGQAIATGAIGGGIFGLTTGFWNFAPLVPTAAQVSVAGRVVDLNGNGVFNAVLYMHLNGGEMRLARSSSFGYFQFENIEAGQTVMISVQARRFTYMPRVVNVAEDIVDLTFMPELP